MSTRMSIGSSIVLIRESSVQEFFYYRARSTMAQFPVRKSLAVHKTTK
jgi:hypothetical protein